MFGVGTGAEGKGSVLAGLPVRCPAYTHLERFSRHLTRNKELYRVPLTLSLASQKTDDEK